MSVRRPHRLALLTAATALLALPCAADPPVKEEDEQEAAFRKAVQTAEVHGIAVGRPAVATLSTRDVKNWPKLFEAIVAAKGPASRVRQFMPERVQKLTAEDGIAEQLATPRPPPQAEGLKGDFKYGFHEILDAPDFYTEEAFKGVTLPDEVKSLVQLGKKRTAWQTACMNWGLMQVTFPDSIPETPARFRTIRVQVRGDKDVVLVLSCSSECHWEVVVKPGGKVTGVILCGTEPQEVEWIENPVKAAVVYRAAHAIDGTRRLKPGDEYFDGFELRDHPDKKFEVRDKFDAGMKKLLGKDFTSLVREGDPGPKSEPYVISPGAKK